MNCLKSVALLSCFLMASQSMGQTPQPIRNPGFGQVGNTYPSAVYPAQYQQRVGKQVSTNQRRTVRPSNGGLAALPWVERFLKPKKEKATVDYDKISVAESQPPLSNSGSPPAPNSRVEYGNIPSQPPVVGQSPAAPVASRQPSIQSESGTGRFSARFSDADPAASGIYPQPTPNPVVPRIKLNPEPGRTAVSPSRQADSAVRRPSSTIESLPNPKTNSERIGSSEDKFLARLQEQSAPKVSRVPIKRTQNDVKKSPTETPERVALANAPSPQAESESRVPQVLSNHGAKRSISDLDEVAKAEPVDVGALVPEQLEVPAKLIAAPRVDDAAKKNVNAKVNGQFITSQLQRPVQPSQPTPAETKTVRGNATGPDLPLPTAEASVSVPRVPILPRTRSELPKAEEPKSVLPLPKAAVPATTAPTQEAVAEREPTSPGPEEFSIPRNPLQPELPGPLPELPVGLPESPKSESPVSVKSNELPELPKASTNVESNLPPSNSPPAVPKLPNLEELPNSQPEPLLQMPPKSAPLPELGNRTTGTPPNEKLEPLPSPVLPNPEIENLPAKKEAPEAPAESVAAPRASTPSNKVQSPIKRKIIPPAKVEEPKRNADPEGRTFGTLNSNGTAFGVAPEQRMNMQSPGVQVLVHGPETIAVATPNAYEIIAINRDTVDLNGLMLRLEVPAGVQVQASKNMFSIEKAPDGATLVTWGIEKLPAGEQTKASVNLTSRKDADFTIGLDWTLIPISRQAKVSVIAPALRVAIDGPQDVIYGKPNTYRIRILNEGKAAARDVKFQLSIPQMGTQQTDIGRIEPGKEEVLEYDLVFEQRGGTRLDALASASNGLKAMGQTQVLVRRQDLQASLVAPELVYHGSAVNYRVNLSNRGDAMSKRTEAVLQLPEGTKPLGLPYSAKLDGNQLTWAVDPIAPSEGREYNFQLSLTSEGEHRVAFECKGDAGQAVSAAATTVVQSIADLKLLVSDPTAPAPVGAEVTYELELINRGSKAANNVRVVAQFSKGVEPIRADGHQYRLVPGQVFFDPIASVGPGKKIKLRIFATADDAGIHRFRAEVKSEDEAIRLVQEESTQYLKTKTRVASPPASSSPLR